MADVAGDEITKEAVRQATIAARWAQAYHRTPLGKLTLDASTMSEVLRLHLLASGGRCGDNSSKWRYYNILSKIIAYPRSRLSGSSNM